MHVFQLAYGMETSDSLKGTSSRSKLATSHFGEFALLDKRCSKRMTFSAIQQQFRIVSWAQLTIVVSVTCCSDFTDLSRDANMGRYPRS
jgi:hypothetical protein